jgi:hypothetical protein
VLSLSTLALPATGTQYEVVTTTAELPVLLMPGHSLRQQYEHRVSPTLVERRCDGTEMTDGSPCACNAEGFTGEECDLVTRLTVAPNCPVDGRQSRRFFRRIRSEIDS